MGNEKDNAGKKNQITKISFKNYKGFEKGEIEVKPITIFLGANSSGKSSIVHLFSMLQRTARREKNHSALILNDDDAPYLNMGTCENIIRNEAKDREMTISFDFINDELSKDLLALNNNLKRFCIFSATESYPKRSSSKSLIRNQTNHMDFFDEIVKSVLVKNKTFDKSSLCTVYNANIKTKYLQSQFSEMCDFGESLINDRGESLINQHSKYRISINFRGLETSMQVSSLIVQVMLGREENYYDLCRVCIDTNNKVSLVSIKKI